MVRIWTFSVHVSRDDIQTWLGDLPCMLLVNDLNQLVALTDRSHLKCANICGGFFEARESLL